MGVMYTRDLIPLNKPFFLFGPRGTGKSTWIKTIFPDSYRIDLLSNATALRYLKDPNVLALEVKALPKDKWIIVDEVQKVPQLLDEIHSLMENDGYKRFVLSGSSARKLKRGAANMLAGRARLKHMYALNEHETNFTISFNQRLRLGMLPMSLLADDDKDREDYLRSYVETYLNEEIKAEGLTRNIGNFARFLDIASILAGTQANVSGIARDAGIGRDTVRGYFSVFEDTLLGSWLSAYRPRAKVKEVVNPKFYWFDTGVLNAAAGAFNQPMPQDWTGVLFEHAVYHEIVSYLAYSEIKGNLGFWRTPSGTEIDFVWWYGNCVVGIEAKASTNFRKDFLKGINSFSEHGKLKSSYIVYNGTKELKAGGTWVMPFRSFAKRLHEGEIFETS